jgi:hypothetical protein
MADPLGSAEPDAPTGSPVQPRSTRKHRKRFFLAYLVLALALGGAAAGLVILLGKPGAGPGLAWSSWQPAGEPEEMAQQIADHVGSQYRLENGQQLVGVRAAPPRVQDVPIGAIATRKPPEGGSEPLIDVFSAEDSVVYILCGLGQNCAIEEGTPSTERLRLLRREALELALYTFRYIDEKESVVAFLPPARGEQPSLALFFRRGDLETALDQPLRTTLPDQTPPPPEGISPFEINTIDRLTAPSLFRFQFQQLQDGTAVLVLDDPRLQPPEEQQGDTGSTGSETTTGSGATEEDGTVQGSQTIPGSGPIAGSETAQ